MVKALNHDDDDALVAECDPGTEPDAPLSDDALLDLLDALVEERGRVPAAGVLRVNYRTLAFCCDSRQVSRRMRWALLDFGNADATGGVGEVENGDGGVAALGRRVSDLEEENCELRELVDGQARQSERSRYC